MLFISAMTFENVELRPIVIALNLRWQCQKVAFEMREKFIPIIVLMHR